MSSRRTIDAETDLDGFKGGDNSPLPEIEPER